MLLLLAVTSTGRPAFAADPPQLAGPAFALFNDPAAVNTDCERGLAQAAGLLGRLVKRPADARWVAADDDFNAAVEDLSSPVQFVVTVHPDKSVRDATQACELRWQDFFFSTLGQNRKLYAAAKAAKARDAIDRTFLKDTIDNFVDAGVSLTEPQRRRAKQLSDRMSEISQQFSRNVRDDQTRVTCGVDELVGVPDNVWKDKPRDDQGRVLLGVDAPTMQRCSNAPTARRPASACTGPATRSAARPISRCSANSAGCAASTPSCSVKRATPTSCCAAAWR